MKAFAYSMTHHLPNYRKSVLLTVTLHCETDITDSVSGNSFLGTKIQ